MHTNFEIIFWEGEELKLPPGRSPNPIMGV